MSNDLNQYARLFLFLLVFPVALLLFRVGELLISTIGGIRGVRKR